MTPIKRSSAALSAAVLLALSLTACGGAPTDASKEDYCEAIGENGGDELTKALEEEDYDKLAELFKESAEDIEKVGTPEDISDDAREGFEIQVETFKDLDGDAVEKAFDTEGDEDPFEDDLSKDEKKKVEAYSAYENETCSD